MGRRWSYLPLVALLGAAAAVLPAVASSETSPAVVATNGSGLYGTPHTWSPSEVTVIAGGVVTFSNPSSTIYHGLKFTGGSAGTAPSCTGLPPGATGESGAPSWEGQCTFNEPGTYTFICTVHPTEMKGTVTVNASGTTTVTTTPTTNPAPTPTTTTPSESPGSASPLSAKPTLRASQRGGVVRGSLVISKAGAGDELEIDLLTSTASLAGRHAGRQASVGRLFRASVAAGRLPFSIRLSKRGRRALAHHRRLALTVRIVLTPVYGEATRFTRTVIERP